LSRHRGNTAKKCLPQHCAATSTVRPGSARHGEDTALTIHVTILIKYFKIIFKIFSKYHATHSTNEKPILQQNINQTHNKWVQENNYDILTF
jgi:hypothetical protein